VDNLFDQIAKKIGKEALDASGLTVIQYEITRGASHADLYHDPDPLRSAERARLGLLGRIAAFLCLLEVYAHAPRGSELRACLIKHFISWEQHQRKTRAQNKKRTAEELPTVPFVKPVLWLLVAAVSTPMLRELEAAAASGWPSGVYAFGGDVLRVRIVVASELPRDRSTLLVRLMAAGPLLSDALADLAALPEDAHERTVAEETLVELQQRFEKKRRRTREEEEFVMSMQGTWKEARKLGRDEGRTEGRDEGRTQGRDEGRIQGRAEEAARAVLTALRVRGLAVPDAARERILAQKDPERLERWLEKAIVAASVADVIDEPS
jgi:hypothetical protein